MILYIAQIIILTLFSVYGNYGVNARKPGQHTQVDLLFFSFIILGFTMCMRSNLIGSDTSTYSRIYEKIAGTTSISQAFKVSHLSAPVYVLFVFTLSRFFSFGQAITIVSSFIICSVMYKAIKMSSKNYLHSVLLFVLLTLYYEAFNGARQMLSVVFAVYAFYILKDNLKSLKGWIIILLAIGIHNTGIFFLVALIGVWLSNYSGDNKTLFIKTAILSVASTAFFGIGINLMTKYFPRYVMYINGSNPESILEKSGGGRIAILYILELLIVISYIALSKKSAQALLPSEKKTLPALIFCCVCGIAFSKNILIQRLLWYYEALFVASIPNMLTAIKKKYRRFIWLGVYVALLVYAIWFLLENKGHIVPYEFFWN